MKSIAFIFSNAPHGNSISREGLDVIISFSVSTNKIGLFFIEDGVFQLIPKQNPQLIFSRNYIKTFKILLLYGITDFFFCEKSMQDRGLKKFNNFILDIKLVNSKHLKKYINTFDFVFKW
ncbi:sulfur transfer complex subunit TusC [Buchnera aphidicola (Cinara tujafilina)]|uniref:Sulfur transfer complex subunit TusC n=1 Tax=Buchnera aphidicola (Cinara tujafilina) TaxID=261317 RepID=F7WZV9_9GAMM|nr:sulfurtransferase complex subunit TusC [Buchnera aphidicola]AEH39924.1 sulfur transfer complex subunit TusC [Buchnera aphidicola (Cinara tujafilina)]